MGEEAQSGATSGDASIQKLSRVEDGHRIKKRPLTRPPLPSSPKTPVIYVSTKTPFMAAVSRVKKHLDKPIRFRGGVAPARKNATLHSRIEALKHADADNSNVTVTVMGTGKAVEKVLAVASWFEQQADCRVELRTKTVATVDDVVVEDGGDEEESRVRRMSCLQVKISLK